ncbi:nucleotidyl transferase AbiEii/AbiGii toxin family protein [Rhizobium laguerreae]|uniref:nucleotidyl transferase AbiEii/AbiGii toxin family protein n=1 Tax=Rhizobium laguerreae TaxID=1076926 RepID=UPI0021B11C2F|nr:nucleotidyl transferase AbiEii/AbiGii toxin family protein [Rhizobium laguerreae]
MVEAHLARRWRRRYARRGEAGPDRNQDRNLSGRPRHGAPVEQHRVSERVEDQFGFAEMQVVAFEDLFGGKLHAAVDRQHPRDLFDVKLLYEHEELTDPLFRTFLV